jgi:glutamate-1-semialdehyde aminotransferase
MLTGFFTGEPVVDLVSAKRSDTARYGRFFHGMLERGVSWPRPSSRRHSSPSRIPKRTSIPRPDAAAETLQTLG